MEKHPSWDVFWPSFTLSLANVDLFSLSFVCLFVFCFFPPQNKSGDMYKAAAFSAYMKTLLFGPRGMLASVNVLRSSFINWASGKELVFLVFVVALLCFFCFVLHGLGLAFVLFLFAFLNLLTDLFFSLLFSPFER